MNKTKIYFLYLTFYIEHEAYIFSLLNSTLLQKITLISNLEVMTDEVFFILLGK